MNQKQNDCLEKKPMVVVGMSGGVDSSVAAYLLKKQGYEVVGVTMQIWQQEDSDYVENNGGCCGWSAVDDARRVCDRIEIPHYVMNFREEFKCSVIDDFVREYVSGRTPNPCIRCNRYVKWEALLNRSLEIGADYIATGHYAKVGRLENGRFAVQKSKTVKKDQTYALYNLTQKQLSHTLFPIGEYEKSEVRSIAEEAGLSVAHKKDSQEICFIPDNDYGKYLRETGVTLPPEGEFVDLQGRVLGRHKGIHEYTIGQRKGLGLSSSSPYFVCSIDVKENRVVLGRAEDVFSSVLYCNTLNYMGAERFYDGMRVSAKIRYGASEETCTLSYETEEVLKCVFDRPVRAATPGQAVVFYDGDTVLGGGIIMLPAE